MSKLTGVGGTTESITKRNPTQRKLGVAMDAFEKEAKTLGVNGISGYESLIKEIMQIASEISKLQGEKGSKEREKADILALENRLADAYVDFAKGVLRISGKGVEIVRLIDPTLPASTTEVDIQNHLNDTNFITLLKNQAKSLDDALMTNFENKVGEAGSTDFSELFSLLRGIREGYKAEAPKLAQIQADIEKLTTDITANKSEKAKKEGTKSKLDPLYAEMKKLESKGNTTTAISRIVNMAAGAVLATGVVFGSGAMKQGSPSAPVASQTVSAVTNIGNSVIASGHTITNSNGVFSVVPVNNTTTMKTSDGTQFQFNTNTRTMNYKLSGGQWVDGTPLGFTGNSGEVDAGGKKYKIDFTASSIQVIPQ